MPKSNQIVTNTQSHRFQALDHKKQEFFTFQSSTQHSSPPNFYPNKYKHTNYMTMTIIQNQRERAKLFQTYIYMPKRLRASKIILDIFIWRTRQKKRASKLFLIVCLYVQRANRAHKNIIFIPIIFGHQRPHHIITKHKDSRPLS